MGGIRLSTRQNIFSFFGVISILGFLILFYFIDKGVDDAVSGWQTSHKVVEIISQIETGINAIKDKEELLLLNGEVDRVKEFEQVLASISNSLDQLYVLSKKTSISSVITTLRDGLIQYNDQFMQFIAFQHGQRFEENKEILLKLQETMVALRVKLKDRNFTKLSDQITELRFKEEEILLFPLNDNNEKIGKFFQNLRGSFKNYGLTVGSDKKIYDLLISHENYFLLLLSNRSIINREKERFKDILAYVKPSVDLLSAFATKSSIAADKLLEENFLWGRSIRSITAGLIILILTLVGVLSLRKIINGIRRVANTALRVASGERDVVFLESQNADALGQIVRTLMKWSDDLSDMAQIRQELLETRKKLADSLQEADRKASATVEAAKTALLAEVASVKTQEADFLKVEEYSSEKKGELDKVHKSLIIGDDIFPINKQVNSGPISSVSQNVANISGFVSTAAADVERVENLIQALEESNTKIVTLGDLIAYVRDQTNSLISKPIEDRDSRNLNNLIKLNEDVSGKLINQSSDSLSLTYVNDIGEAVKRAERTLQELKWSIGKVTNLANQIASTASNQALDATKKLLSQSEHLQKMLDKIINKITLSKAEEGLSSSQGEGKEIV